MAPLALSAAQGERVPDVFAVGLLLAIVGCFLLANSIVFRHPRTLVEQFFGQEERRLTSIRAYIFHRVQVHLGFLFLLGGLGLQLFGRFGSAAAKAGTTEVPLPWVGLVVLAVVVLELGGWWLSHALFRRYVREFFLQHPPDLEADLTLARELGELFGIPSQGDDSVPSYLLRIRHRIGLLGTATVAERGPRRRDRDDVEEEEFDLTP